MGVQVIVRKLVDSRWFIPTSLFVVAGVYYWALSSKIFTWIYTSGDAGDWLTLTNWWMVPQCWGKPFYILLIKLVSLLPGDNDIFKITLLSILAGAVMVMLTYLIAKQMTNDKKFSLLASAIVLGSNIILSQATVLEQYTVLGALFLSFYYFYIKDKLFWAAMFLGLTAAVHELGLIFILLFLFVEWDRIKSLLKYAPVVILFGLVPYGLIFGMMASPETPKLLGGFLTWDSLNAYGGNTTVTAALALTEAPAKLLQAVMMLSTSLGLAIVPIVIGFKKPWDKHKKFILATFGFSFWFYFTNLFPSTWKFLVPTIPLIVVVGIVTLSKLPRWHTTLVTLGACILILANSFMFNAQSITEDKPLATEYYEAVMGLPDGAAIITPRGGAYGFTIFYAMSEGKDIIPLALSNPADGWLSPVENQGYKDYLWWLEKEYSIVGTNTYEIVKDAMSKGHPIYYATPMTKVWQPAFAFEKNEQDYLYVVNDVRAEPAFINTNKDSTWGNYWQLKEKSDEQD